MPVYSIQVKRGCGMSWPYIMSLDQLRRKIRDYSYIDHATPFIRGVHCRIWGRALNSRGYGLICTGDGSSTTANRVALAIALGRGIERGHESDHLCFNTACVEAKHLREVTPLTNNRCSRNPCAINLRKTHCKRGHALAGDNLIIKIKRSGSPMRNCRICMNMLARERYRRDAS